jgi:putative ABC transport system permease protein
MNKIIRAFKIGLNALNTNIIKSILTVLGIVIGISAVITIFSVGESITEYFVDQIRAFGSNMIHTEIKVPQTSQESLENVFGLAMGTTITTLTKKDAEKIEQLPNIENNYAAAMGQAVVVYGNITRSTFLFGVTPEYINIDKAKIDKGRFFTEMENGSSVRVVVLGHNLADEFFGNENPIGKSIKIKKIRFKVIGVLDERGTTFGISFDDFAFLPLKTLQDRIMGIDYVSYITSTMKDPKKGDITKAQIERLLRDRHNIDDPKDDDFAVATMEEAQEILDNILGGISLLLIAIACISLFVGGVGIMNIMYLSVFERTYEIGLRKSVGASKKDILFQFLTEAVVLTLTGAIFGILLGILFTYLINYIAGNYGFDWKFIIDWNGVIIAVAFAMIIGVLFGLYPALKAASLDPIKALREK